MMNEVQNNGIKSANLGVNIGEYQCLLTKAITKKGLKKHFFAYTCIVKQDPVAMDHDL